MREKHGEHVVVSHQRLQRVLYAAVLLEAVGGFLLRGQRQEHQQLDCTRSRDRESEHLEETNRGGARFLAKLTRVQDGVISLAVVGENERQQVLLHDVPRVQLHHHRALARRVAPQEPQQVLQRFCGGRKKSGF